MTKAQLARILVEGPDQKTLDGAERGDKPKIDKKIAVFLTRLLLRIFSVPSLLTYLADVSLSQDEDASDGICKIQLDFLRLPDEVHPQLMKLCAAPTTPKLLRYVKNGSARTGVEFQIKPDDLGGEDYEYAY